MERERRASRVSWRGARDFDTPSQTAWGSIEQTISDSGFCFKSQIDLDLPSELRGKIQNMALAGQDTSLVNNVGGSERP